MPKVSVIIPSYNHGKYVAEAIQSVLDQTYQDFEIVITDDGSTDNTVEVIKTFKDPRIRLFCFDQNRGAAVATNNCIEQSKGELIALLNSDDSFKAEKLETQVNFLDENTNVGAVFSYANFIDEKSNDIKESHFCENVFNVSNKSRFEWLNYFFFHGNCLCHPSVLIRNQCYESVGLYDPCLTQLPDFDLWIRLCIHHEIYIIEQQLINFRIRDNERNASSPTPQNIICSSIEYYQVLNKNYLNPNVYNHIAKIFPKYIKTDLNLDKELAIFRIATIALECNYCVNNSFGINTLYKLIQENPKIIKILKNKYNFDYKMLTKIRTEYDVYNIISLQKTLQKIESLETTIKNMKKSFFWKLRDYWLKFKSLFIFSK